MVQWGRRPDLIAIIDGCISANMSGAACARAINELHPGLNVTRDSCIAQAWRCGKRFQSGANANSTRKRPMLKRPNRPRPAYAMQPDIKPLPHTFEEQSALDQEIPVGRRKRLLELESRDCRWPVGEPNRPDFFFCGHPSADLNANRPYCEIHAARARSPSQPR